MKITLNKSTLIVGVLGLVLAISIFTGGFDFTGAATSSGSGTTTVKTTIQNFEYSPDTFTVKEGEKITLTITNKDTVSHGLHLMQFGLMGSTPAGSTKTFEFVAKETSANGQAIPTCSQEHGETLTINVI